MPNAISLNRTLDTDLQAFLTATGITDATQTSALNCLVGGLKYYSLWSKMIAIYPLVGGSASLHKWNLKDPRDLDAAYRLTYSGTLTHNANGITGGASGFANTKMTPSVSLSLNDCHLAAYSRTSTNINGPIIAVGETGIVKRLEIYPRYTDGNFYSQVGASTENSVTNVSGAGLFAVSRTASNVVKSYKNGSIIINASTASTALPAFEIYLLNFNQSGTQTAAWVGNAAFYSIGSSLTDSDVVNLNTIVQNYQSILGRKV